MLDGVKELDRSIINMCSARIGRYPSTATDGVSPTHYCMIGDSNIPDNDHFLYNWSEVNTPKGYEFFILKDGDGWKQNPNAENLSNLPKKLLYRNYARKTL